MEVTGTVEVTMRSVANHKFGKIGHSAVTKNRDEKKEKRSSKWKNGQLAI